MAAQPQSVLLSYWFRVGWVGRVGASFFWIAAIAVSIGACIVIVHDMMLKRVLSLIVWCIGVLHVSCHAGCGIIGEHRVDYSVACDRP